MCPGTCTFRPKPLQRGEQNRTRAEEQKQPIIVPETAPAVHIIRCQLPLAVARTWELQTARRSMLRLHPAAEQPGLVKGFLEEF